VDRIFIEGACRKCPHVRLVGGEPPDWRVQLCLYHIDQARGPERGSISVEELRSLDVCPDTARAARFAGVGA
jgi:hypothetical protein